MKYVEWTPEKINAFWREIWASPLAKLSFSKIGAPKLADLFAPVLEKAGRVLDYGAGNGDFTRELMRRGVKVGMYDPGSGDGADSPAAEFASSPLFLGREQGEGRGDYDLVLCFEVLEHMDEAAMNEAYRLIASHLAPGGRLLVTVPANEDIDLSSCLCPECHAFFHRFQHMRSYSQQGLRDEVEKHGFDVEQCLHFHLDEAQFEVFRVQMIRQALDESAGKPAEEVLETVRKLAVKQFKPGEYWCGYGFFCLAKLRDA